MDIKDVILELRTKKGLSQDELAEKLSVTRQAISRWEIGETIPNTETLKLLPKFFDVSINTLLGSSRQLICQCYGMTLDDSSISKEPDGTFNCQTRTGLLNKHEPFLKLNYLNLIIGISQIIKPTELRLLCSRLKRINPIQTTFLF